MADKGKSTSVLSTLNGHPDANHPVWLARIISRSKVKNEIISALWFGVAALAGFTGAYVAEMVRAGIQFIHRGQTEAARSLGMTYVKSMRYLILPRALRRILPPLAGQFISLIKDSSLLALSLFAS